MNKPDMTDEAMWDELVYPHIPEAWNEAVALVNSPPRSADIEMMRSRFVAGNKEHGGDIWTWEDEKFPKEIAEEFYDLVIYCALRRAVRHFQRQRGLTKANMG